MLTWLLEHVVRMLPSFPFSPLKKNINMVMTHSEDRGFNKVSYSLILEQIYLLNKIG